MNKENVNNSFIVSREYAIKEATQFGLQNEVIYCMDLLGMSPDEALLEWSI